MILNKNKGQLIINDWYDCQNIYGYIYKTILPDCRTYIGQKKGYPIVEKYFGSSEHLNNWFLKNIGFKSSNCPLEAAEDKGVIRIILAYAIDQEELNSLEKFFIKKEKEESEKNFCLNITDGGNGTEYKELSEEGRKKSIEALLDPENRNKGLETKKKKRELGLSSCSAETLKKRSEGIKKALKEKPIWNKGLNKETDPRIVKMFKWRELNKEYAHLVSKKANEASVEKIKGTKWWNNGEIQVRAKECPEGFVHGMLDWKKDKKITFSEEHKKHLSESAKKRKRSSEE